MADKLKQLQYLQLVNRVTAGGSRWPCSSGGCMRCTCCCWSTALQRRMCLYLVQRTGECTKSV